MVNPTPRLEQAFELFDNYNKNDPNEVENDGTTYPATYFHALQLHKWVSQLEPEASELLLLASRAQHIGRWTSPRSDYPEGKAGYLNWRKDLKLFHAQTAGELLAKAGYTPDEITGVRHIILKENIKLDHQVQVIENALCLFFLEFQLEDFIEKQPGEQVVRILKKTWKKMSAPGHEAALRLTYSDHAQKLIATALAPIQ